MRNKMWIGVLFGIVTIAPLIGAGLACSKDWPPVVQDSADVLALPPETLSVRARRLQDEDIWSLERRGGLVHIDFDSGWASYDARVGDEGLKLLSELELPHLSELNLGHNDLITDAGVGYVLRISYLSWLGLSACSQLTDASINNVAARGGFKHLDLRGCPGISDDGVLHLTSMRSLDWLLLDGCANVSAQAISELRAALPNTKVTKDDSEWENTHERFR